MRSIVGSLKIISIPSSSPDMYFLADLHVHSHFARATSKYLNLESLYQWGQLKGIHVIGTGDFTHPLWYHELSQKLEPDGTGLYKLKNPPVDQGLEGAYPDGIDIRFMLSVEISSIYKKKGKVRKNHNLVYAPDLNVVKRLNQRLAEIGNLASDGRPILGLPSRDLLEIVKEASEDAHLIPAHIWTPWFSTLGSRGGYDHVADCFEDLTDEIFALETGLSSDPAMNWRWSELDRFTLVSSSDAHSPQKLGREANRFDTDRSYQGIFDAIRSRMGFLGTYEFFPEEGKYHMDGHRKCGVVLSPEASLEHHNTCPVCGKPLTIGVLHRVVVLSDRSNPLQPRGAPGYEYIIPLPEILAEIKGVGPNTKTVMRTYAALITAFGNEFNLLTQVPIEAIRQAGYDRVGEAIYRMRSGAVNPQPGYDGEYGKIRIFP